MFNPLRVAVTLGNSGQIAEKQIARMMAIRDSAIHQRDDESLGILIGWLVESPEAQWSKDEIPWVRQLGRGKASPSAQQQDQGKVTRAELVTQLMQAFEISEAKLKQLIHIGRAAVDEPGREVERAVWKSAAGFG